MYQLCAFDLDGTIADTIGDLADALNHGLTQNGFDALPVSRVQELVGYSVVYMCKNALPEDVREQCWRDVYAAYDQYYAKHCCDHTRPYEGILRTLQRLKNAGMRLAVVSNKPHRHATHVVETLFPRDTFSMVLGMMEKFEKKPAPQPLQFVLDYLGVEKSDAVYVGDSEVDVAFAKNTGLDCVSVTWGLRSRKTLLDAGAQCLIDDPEELLDLLL